MDLTMILLGLGVVAILALIVGYVASARNRLSRTLPVGDVRSGIAPDAADSPATPPIPEEALAGERSFAPRAQWTEFPPGELRSAELADGAGRSTGPVDAFRVPARLGDYEEEIELLWFRTTGRAAVAFAGRSFWTNARSPEAALRAWSSDRASGVRTAPR